jgi:hypoxanthine phosphoribosyltransferase
MKIKDKEFEVLISRDQIDKRVKEIAAQINEDYRDKDPIFLAILNGSFMFASDLMKEISIASRISFIKVASYYHTASTGEVKKLIGLHEDITQRNIVIVEDIVDTGFTLEKTMEEVETANPSSIEVATCLLKPDALQREVELKYVGFEISNEFVIGYGLDYDGYGRNSGDIYQIKS